MAIQLNHFSFFLLSLLLLSFPIISKSKSVIHTTATNHQDDCVYTVYIRTSNTIKGGTDSIISLKLYNSHGNFIEIPNIEIWGGLMEPGHDYFERGNLDIFSGRGECLNTPVCAMNLTSDGSGSGHGWYVNYVEVTTTGAHIPCHQKLVTVNQWLALDRSPYNLTAIRNYCPKSRVSSV